MQMHKLVDRFAKVPMASTSALASDGGRSDAQTVLGRGIERMPMPQFSVPSVENPTAFLQMHTDDASDPSCKIKIKHGTTTLAFKYKGGIIVAVDSRATQGSYIASGTVKKVIEINPYLLGTMAGGAADCQYWETYLGIQCRLHELRNKERISVAAASKYLSNLVYSYKGMGLSMGTMICGWDKTGPALFYVDSDGTRLKGDLFSVGSGSTFAYGVLDQGYSPDLTDDEAYQLGLRSIYAAGHRDAFSGNTVNLYHVKEDGWKFIENVNINELHYERKFGYDVRTQEARDKLEREREQQRQGTSASTTTTEVPVGA
ncbi:Proteasome subunit beta type-5, variant 2 [Microbotryomycetes sp. NB124-2]